MRIKRAVFQKLITSCPIVPPEVGGILGSHSGIVDTVVFDTGSRIMKSAVYIPDATYLNSELEKWHHEEISFCGLFHSHPRGQETLSKDDIEYIQTIMFSLPDTVSQLFFPIVIPNSHLISYKAINQNHSILIVDDTIDLVP